MVADGSKFTFGDIDSADLYEPDRRPLVGSAGEPDSESQQQHTGSAGNVTRSCGGLCVACAPGVSQAHVAGAWRVEAASQDVGSMSLLPCHPNHTTLGGNRRISSQKGRFRSMSTGHLHLS